MTKLALSQAEALAQHFHEAYERLAPQFGYETRKESAKPWSEVPEQNRALMIAVCGEIIRLLVKPDTVPMVKRATGRTIPDMTKREHICEFQNSLTVGEAGQVGEGGKMPKHILGMEPENVARKMIDNYRATMGPDFHDEDCLKLMMEFNQWLISINETLQELVLDKINTNLPGPIIVQNSPSSLKEAWISVEEKVPELDSYVLTWQPSRWANHYVLVMYTKKADDHRKFTRRDGQWWNNGNQITHWMPLLPGPVPDREAKEATEE